MNSNKKIATSILKSILLTKSGKLSLQKLEDNIFASINAMDSTFPKETRVILGKLVSTIRYQKTLNGADALNAPEEFIYDENKGVDAILDQAIQSIQTYLD